MKKIDYDELYSLLCNMKESSKLMDLSVKMYWSESKTSKKVKAYEHKLKRSLYFKNSINILSTEGELLLQKLEEPIKNIRTIVNVGENILGVDENLIEDKINLSILEDFKVIYMDSKTLIEKYRLGELDNIVVSSDFEESLDFANKEMIINKKVYFIKKKNCDKETVFANEVGCPIRKKIEKKGIVIDRTFSQSLSICKMIKEGEGIGYTFSVDTLNPNDIHIEDTPQLAILFFMYNKYKI